VRFSGFLKKELLLLSRDLHGLALLFVMPILFILIMSLAMQNTFSEHSAVKIEYLLVNEDNRAASQWLEMNLAASGHFEQTEGDADFEALRERIQSDEVQFLVRIPQGFSDSLNSQSATIEPIELLVAPATQAPTVLLFENKLRELTSRLYVDVVVGMLGANADNLDLAGLDSSVKVESTGTEAELLPTSVQQNVPAWLVFSMFFIAIPVSTTLLGERGQGTLHRLSSMGVSRVQFLLAKLVTYMLVNFVQVVSMFAVGLWVVPLFGGDALTLGNSPLALVLIALGISFAAVSFALVIANLARTTEQATVMAGASNIILAAVGGIMVPRFIMPATMQKFSMLVPHAWGLEGFLDVILRGGGIADIVPEFGLLVLFGAVMLLLSVLLLRRV